MKTKASILASALILLATSSSATPWKFRQAELADGTKIEIALVLPTDFDAAKTYPAVLVLPPGPQNRQMVVAGISTWAAEAQKRGWIVVSPAVPSFELFFNGAERHVPGLLAVLRKELRFEHDALHLFGLSNGGRSAFRVATLHPDDFLSVTVAPGFPVAEDEERLAVLAKKPVTLIVGQDDGGWLERSRKTQKQLKSLGGQATLEVLPGVGHSVLRSYPVSRLLKVLERARATISKAPARGRPTRPAP